MEKHNRRLRSWFKSARPRYHVPKTAYGIAVAALITFGCVAAAVTAIAIVESYSNLLAFALDHGLHGWRAAIAPGAVDSFIVMGELLLFAGFLLDWDSPLAFTLGTVMTLWGFALSVGGNVWHAASATGVDRAVAAIWPVTATAGLAGGLIIIRRVMAGHGTGQAVAPGAMAKTPPPASSSRGREPRRAVTVRAARTAGLAVASEVRAQVVLDLLRVPALPSVRQLVASDARLNGSRRTAASVLQEVREKRNGTGSGDGDGS